MVTRIVAPCLALAAGIALRAAPAQAQDSLARSPAVERTTPRDPAAPRWFLEHLDHLTREGGRWVADNSAYRSDGEPFPSYGLAFTLGPSGRTARGRLFGIREDGREEDFWEFHLHWDPLAGKAIAQQTHLNGAFGSGELRPAGPGANEVEQTFVWGDGSVTRSLHRERVSDNERRAESFECRDGEWVPRRQYVWRRAALPAPADGDLPGIPPGR